MAKKIVKAEELVPRRKNNKRLASEEEDSKLQKRSLRYTSVQGDIGGGRKMDMTDLCRFYRTNGHVPSFCRQKREMMMEEVESDSKDGVEVVVDDSAQDDNEETLPDVESEVESLKESLEETEKDEEEEDENTNVDNDIKAAEVETMENNDLEELSGVGDLIRGQEPGGLLDAEAEPDMQDDLPPLLNDPSQVQTKPLDEEHEFGDQIRYSLVKTPVFKPPPPPVVPIYHVPQPSLIYPYHFHPFYYYHRVPIYPPPTQLVPASGSSVSVSPVYGYRPKAGVRTADRPSVGKVVGTALAAGAGLALANHYFNNKRPQQQYYNGYRPQGYYPPPPAPPQHHPYYYPGSYNRPPTQQWGGHNSYYYGRSNGEAIDQFVAKEATNDGQMPADGQRIKRDIEEHPILFPDSELETPEEHEAKIETTLNKNDDVEKESKEKSEKKKKKKKPSKGALAAAGVLAGLGGLAFTNHLLNNQNVYNPHRPQQQHYYQPPISQYQPSYHQPSFPPPQLSYPSYPQQYPQSFGSYPSRPQYQQSYSTHSFSSPVSSYIHHHPHSGFIGRHEVDTFQRGALFLPSNGIYTLRAY